MKSMSGDADKLTATLRAPLLQEIASKQKEVQESWKKLEEKTREIGKRLNANLRCVLLQTLSCCLVNFYICVFRANRICASIMYKCVQVLCIAVTPSIYIYTSALYAVYLISFADTLNIRKENKSCCRGYVR